MRNLSFFLIGVFCSLIGNVAHGAGPTIVQLQTNLGTIAIQPNFTQTPVTANNFIKYVDSGFYKNTLIHRAQKNFVIQGGGFDKGTGQYKSTPFPAIPLETNKGLHNAKGTIAMARTDTPDSARSQFFINLVDNPMLDYSDPNNPGYAVFGTVTKGLYLANAMGNFLTFNTTQLPYNTAGNLVWVETTYKTTLEPALSRTRILRSGVGTVTSSPAGINCGITCIVTKPNSGTLQLTATAGAGWVFSNWRGDCQGVAKTITLSMAKGDHNCTAVFVIASPSVQ
ncbi:peptidylprolyl isomerase [Methylovulum miyakonense]|uniref:peptidylprolyl isomerase n=1 Tax=Methylovulum miyakonense TaxID=645578 RepID=UPI0003664CEF|nr:peptidylprolyl isomerase [Methylovulum miyakonense]